jgi:hypothetical protein
MEQNPPELDGRVVIAAGAAGGAIDTIVRHMVARLIKR